MLSIIKYKSETAGTIFREEKNLKPRDFKKCIELPWLVKSRSTHNLYNLSRQIKIDDLTKWLNVNISKVPF